jgi:hypothetical protein
VLNLEKFFLQHHDIKTIDSLYYCRGSRYRVKLPAQFNKDLCRFIGIMHGDGNLSSNRILITDKNIEYHQRVLQPLFKRLFNLPLNLYHDKNRSSYYSHVKSSIIYRYLIGVLEFQAGSVRCSLQKLPSYLSKFPSKYQAYYIAGLYDSEGSIKKKQIEIDFAITSKPIWLYIQEFFNQININYSPRIRKREKWQKNYEIYIYGKDDAIKFIKNIPIVHPAKLKQLNTYF